MGMLDTSEIQKKRLYLLFVLDSSGSMQGANINAVNTACKEVIESQDLREAGGADAEIYLNVLEFNNSCNWMYEIPQPIENFIWKDLIAGGGTSMGESCRELSKKLDKSEFLQAPAGLAAPVLMLMSDGAPTDDFATGVLTLKNNKYYKHCTRFACAVDGANESVLAEWTGGSVEETVIHAHSPEAIKKWIKVVSIVATKTASKTGAASAATAQDVAVQALSEELDPNDFEG
ncbi:tellurium resistance protein TerY [Fibrobacterales bacterium]|nr:tellurium resistance protein TerY [Fibrobacterales bacterium]